MPLTIEVRTDDAVVKTSREATARRVVDAFGKQLPDLKVLCFFDDHDWKPFKDHLGKAVRGFYRPLTAPGFSDPPWPKYVMNLLFVDDPPSWIQKRVFDHVIYLHGSTVMDEVGLTSTFAHELRHFIQWASMPLVYAAGILLLQLVRHWPTETSDALGLRSWADIPHERDARIVSKRVVEDIFGQERAREFIDQKIAERVDPGDEADWRFIQSIVTSDSYDLERETRRLFRRLAPYRDDCEKVLRRQAPHIPELKNVDLDELFKAE